MKFPFVTILFSISILVFSFMGTYYHEKVHQNIFDDYNVPSEIKVFWYGNGLTHPEGNTSNCNENCINMHEMNEIINYNSHAQYFMIALGFFCIIALIELNILTKEE